MKSIYTEVKIKLFWYGQFFVNQPSLTTCLVVKGVYVIKGRVARVCEDFKYYTKTLIIFKTKSSNLSMISMKNTARNLCMILMLHNRILIIYLVFRKISESNPLFRKFTIVFPKINDL